MVEKLFRYPDNDDVPYLSWFRKDFSSVFVATNPFLKIPELPQTTERGCVPFDYEELDFIAKDRGLGCGVSWEEISQLCGLGSMSFVNRTIRLTGSKRLVEKLACPSSTAKMLKHCSQDNIFVPVEGTLSPLSQLSLGDFFSTLGHDDVVGAYTFGLEPQRFATKELLLPDTQGLTEFRALDASFFVTIYVDYHYFLICQTSESLSRANPSLFFEGFFADETTNDLWSWDKAELIGL